MQNQLIELQTQLSFQEQTINELNDVLTSQQKQIDRLEKQIQRLSEQIEEGAEQGNGEIEDERPPHY